jgi:hypothetical protein
VRAIPVLMLAMRGDSPFIVNCFFIDKVGLFLNVESSMVEVRLGDEGAKRMVWFRRVSKECSRGCTCEIDFGLFMLLFRDF